MEIGLYFYSASLLYYLRVIAFRQLFLVLVGEGDAAEGAGCVDVDGVFGFFGGGFAVVGEAAEDEAGF